ncbi:MAG TPA: hypothetical protein VHD87_17660 [Acidimicrobiales bacterium]|nr:hypothetical protein [Acidimicrobiales bacterium]
MAAPMNDDARRAFLSEGTRIGKLATTMQDGLVMVKGTAVVSRNLDDLVAWATKIGGRYMGADRAEEFGRRNGVDGELLVRITPTKTVALANVSGY